MAKFVVRINLAGFRRGETVEIDDDHLRDWAGEIDRGFLEPVDAPPDAILPQFLDARGFSRSKGVDE